MSISDALGSKVTKAFLTNLATAESKPFLFNPAELEEVFAVNYAMLESPGMSHKVLQFVSCENMTWKLVALFDELFYAKNATKPVSAATADPIFGTVEGGLSQIAAASPPPVHFEWPSMISTTIRVRSAKFKHTIFCAGSARPRVFTVELDVFEDPAQRTYSSDVRSQGTIRPWATVSPASRGSIS
jgi:hypothetical protein